MKISKKFFIVPVLILFCFSCEKDKFDPDNPDVELFVQQIKNGAYDNYEKGEDGQNLWLIMPEFTKDHIQALIGYSKDTTHILKYPFNPLSSRTPFPFGRSYSILGECLLWTVEGIRNGNGYGSLDPYLTDSAAIPVHTGLKGGDILIVRDLYQDWWSAFKYGDWKNSNPLKGTHFRWF